MSNLLKARCILRLSVGLNLTPISQLNPRDRELTTGNMLCLSIIDRLTRDPSVEKARVRVELVWAGQLLDLCREAAVRKLSSPKSDLTKFCLNVNTVDLKLATTKFLTREFLRQLRPILYLFHSPKRSVVRLASRALSNLSELYLLPGWTTITIREIWGI
jgi:hypothetical protein